MYRLGIDVGGTNTDAVIMQGRNVLSGVKASTTEDVTSGVLEAMEAAISRAGVDRAKITHVMIGTTHFTNAVIERRHVNPVAAIRLGLPATACLPPMVDWPDDLREAVGGHGYLVRGGYEFDGRELAALDLDEIDRIADDINAKRIGAAAISKTEPADADGLRGVVINTASIAGLEGQTGQIAYSASKGGIIGMTLPAARDLAAIGVRVNTICPGIIDTPIYGSGEQAEAFKAKLAAPVPFPKRMGKASEFAHLVKSLIENDYMNGETIRFDGGIRFQPK